MMIINRKSKIFVAKRMDTKIQAWQMPQGGIDDGEDARTAAMREMLEEIGTDKAEIIAESKDWYHYDLPEELIRDFVGARYQVVMVRIGDDEMPINRDLAFGDPVKEAAMLCRDKNFQKFLIENSEIFDETEEEATEWLKEQLGITSRTELRTNEKARNVMRLIQQDFMLWLQNV